MPNGDSGGFDFSFLANALLGQLADAIVGIFQFLVDLVATLGRVFATIFGQQQFLQGFVTSGLGEVFKGLKEIVEQVFKAVVLAALRHLRDLIAKIQAWAKKLKAWLDKLQKIQRQLQVKAMRDVINLIQRIRQVLAIFRIFHFKWAQKLDAWLSNIEGTIIRNVTRLNRKVNEIITYLNILLDPEVLLRQSILAQSLYRYIRGLRGVLGIPESRPLTTKEQSTQQEDRDLLKKTPQLTDPAVQRILAGLDAAAKEFSS
jgi:hypothetical protein